MVNDHPDEDLLVKLLDRDLQDGVDKVMKCIIRKLSA